MALPTTPPIDFAQNQHICPPFKSSGGSFYAIGLVEGDLTQIAAYKTDDPETDGDWTVQDAAGQPDVGAQDIVALAAVQDGDVVHIVTQNAVRASGMNNFHDVDYHQFNMATDNWDVAAETVDNGQQPQEASVCIAVRSDGDVVVAYMGTVQANMGADFSRPDYNVRTSGTWGGAVAFGVPYQTNAHQRVDSCILGASDRVHFFISEAQGVSPFNFANAHQSLSSGDALDTYSRYEGQSTTARFGHGTPDFDGTDVRVPLQLTSGTLGGIVKFASAANPTITQEAAHDNEILTGPLGALSGMGTAQGVFLFRSGGDRYLLYSDDAGRDLYSDESLGGDGNWGTDVLEDSATVIGFLLSAAIYTRGSNEVIAFLWEEGDAAVEYNEIILPATAASLVVAHPAQNFTVLRL